jgi:glutamate-5-semialdehyde dehydrogenase
MATVLKDPLEQDMQALGRAARVAAQELALAPSPAKDAALRAAADALRAGSAEILAANARDMAAARAKGLSGAMLARLEPPPANRSLRNTLRM